MMMMNDGLLSNLARLRVAWVNPERTRLEDGLPTADRAGVRLRCLEPQRWLCRWGCHVETVNLFDHAAWANDPAFYRSDVVVFGKLFGDVSAVAGQIRRCGGRVVADVCDNVFAPPEDGLMPFYEALLPHADAVVAATSALARELAGRLPPHVPVHVVPDGAEGERGAAAFAPADGRPALLWYG
jgi:hypothetical protein